MGQLPAGAMTLVETAADARKIQPPRPGGPLAYVTQTTLALDETAEILAILQERFPEIRAPRREDICYATTNRQEAVKAVAARSDMVLVIGAPNSSNSRRLVDVASRAGCRKTALIQRARDIDWPALADVGVLGITAGASAPESLVTEVVEACRGRFGAITVEEVITATEDVAFKLPRGLAA